MIRKMTADDIADVMDRSLKRSVAEEFLWEVHTIDGEIVICIGGNETAISADEARDFAKVASGEAIRCRTLWATGLECGWTVNTWAVPPYQGFWILDVGRNISVRMDRCESDKFAMALRGAVQSQSSAGSRTDDNLRSVFG